MIGVSDAIIWKETRNRTFSIATAYKLLSRVQSSHPASQMGQDWKLWGLREGLRLAKNRGIRPLEVEFDSVVLIGLLDKLPDMDHTLFIILQELKELMESLNVISVKHILRVVLRRSSNLFRPVN
ncbi:Ribonuclease H domain [Dillenia turbinata]|uniref:Ribonuclease H domain n=1 Tax=Dillenia turbinata TaxID=194707 RepID=A0AAN8VIR5_9MAGN